MSHYIGIDIGGTMIKGALFDAEGGLLKKNEAPTQASLGPKKMIENIISAITALQQSGTDAAACGIGIAGVLDKERKLLIESPNLADIDHYPLKQVLQDAVNLPCFIENDANVAALGELWAGDGKNLNNYLLLTLGTGIGSGLILNKKLWIGENGKAGEFGHVTVNPDGALCGCGKKGCLEAHSSGSAMVRMAREELEAGKKTSLRDLSSSSHDSLTPKAIYTAARSGDQICLDIFSRVAYYLAIAIADVNNLLDIHHFIIGGGVSKGMDIFEAGLMVEINKRIFAVSRDKMHVIISKLGNDAGVIGAGYLAKTSLKENR